MKTSKKDGRYRYDLTSTELLVLFTLLTEERITASISAFDFANPAEVAGAIKEFKHRTEGFVMGRTDEERTPFFVKK